MFRRLSLKHRDSVPSSKPHHTQLYADEDGVLKQRASDGTVSAVGAGEDGGSQTLAEVLAEGNDTGGTSIVNAPAVHQNASTNIAATATGDGSAAADAQAASADGAASANRAATSTANRAQANTDADGASFTTQANSNAAGHDNNSEARNSASVDGSGTARATIEAHGDSLDEHVAMIECRATASGQSITITGLPSSDPGVPGQLYISAGSLKVSL